MERLMSHSDYEDSIDLPSVSDIEFRIKSRNHRAFLKQPLSIEMFVPCKLVDGGWVVLEKPIMFYSEENIRRLKGIEIEISNSANNRVIEYQEAKERCLFEGFEFVNEIKEHDVFSLEYNTQNKIFDRNDTIEKLLQYKGLEFKLTATALKQIL